MRLTLALAPLLWMTCSDLSSPEPTVEATSTPTPKSSWATKIITVYRTWIQDVRKESNNCSVEDALEDTIRLWSTHNMNFLRAYWEVPDLQPSDARQVVDFLEGERGRYGRLCISEDGSPLPSLEGTEDIIEMVTESIEERHRGESCEIAKDLSGWVSSFSTENVSFLRGLLDLPSLTSEDVSYLIAHFESESGRYAGLCARGE